MLAGVGRGGDWVCRRLGGGGIEGCSAAEGGIAPYRCRVGFGLRHSPPSAAAGDWALPFPTLRCCGGLGFAIPHPPLLRGIGAPPFPTLRCCGGIWPPAFPTLLAGGALATIGKKAHRAPDGALCFFVHRPSLMQACLQRSVRVQKKPSSVA